MSLYLKLFIFTNYIAFSVDMSKSPLDELQFCSKNGPIHYGDVVRLVYEPTGTSLPRLVSCFLVEVI